MTTETPAVIVARIEARAERLTTPCGDGDMVWRAWGDGPPLILLHGGHGSWRHWFRNIPVLARHFRVIAGDIPGLGDTAIPPTPFTLARHAEIISNGIDILVPPPQPFHLAGFSFGGNLGGQVALRQGKRMASLTFAGTAGLDFGRAKIEPLRTWRGVTDPDEAREIQRFNLSQLMFFDTGKIDDLAIYLQSESTRRARTKNSFLWPDQPYPNRDALRPVLPQLDIPINFIWGERDVTAWPHLEKRVEYIREVQPAANIRIIPGAGHWIAYEAADTFNAAFLEMHGLNGAGTGGGAA